MNKDEAEKQLQAALLQLCAEDEHLLNVDASERSITHRLGLYLQGTFPDWHVDCEYNRDGHEPKAVMLDEGQFGGESSVYPDIIIHRRGHDGPNLLVIEVKKNPDLAREEVQHDLRKLRAYKQHLHYSYAVFLKVWTGTSRPNPVMKWV